MYKLDLSTKTYKADLGKEYGVFTIRKMGAGEELELSVCSRELSAMAEKIAPLSGKKEAEFTDDDKQLLRESEELAVKSRERSIEIFKGLFSSETEGAVDKLFNEQSVGTIREIYDGAIEANG